MGLVALYYFADVLKVTDAPEVMLDEVLLQTW
jgi:hypothetical protein